MIYGYAGGASMHESLGAQVVALEKAGCECIYKEQVGTSSKGMPVLSKLLNKLTTGDILIVSSFNSLSRSLTELVGLLTALAERNIAFISLDDSINTMELQGSAVISTFRALAEFEERLYKERTLVRRIAAKKRGRMGGRPRGISQEALEKAKLAKTLYDQRTKTVDEIASILEIGRATVYRYIERAKNEV